MSTCKICSQGLTLELDPESFDEATSSAVGQSSVVPDDLLLQCGCHFHWQCLHDESSEIALSLACPVCDNSIVTGPSAAYQEPRILVKYINEGGVQDNLDILPLVTEEAYLEANPASRPARALITMCEEGDVTGIVELLAAIRDDPEEGGMSPQQLLRFQDPLEGGKTGLHIAIENSQAEVAWLLLWVASSLPTQDFPDTVQVAARELEADRRTSNGVDIRSLRDEQQHTAEDLARNAGGQWGELLSSGFLAAR